MHQNYNYFIARTLVCCLGIWAGGLTAIAQDINQRWMSTDGAVLLRFVESPLGNKFIYQKDTLHLTGDWVRQADQAQELKLAYRWQGMTTDSIAKMVLAEAPPTADSTTAAATTAALRQPYLAAQASQPLPTRVRISSLSDEQLSLQADGAWQLSLRQANPPTTMDKVLNNSILRGIIGIVFLLAVCYLFSRNRRAIDWRTVLSAIVLQAIFAVLILKVPFVRIIFEFISSFFVKILAFTRAGSEFLFSGLITRMDSVGYIFAFQVLPTVIFFSGLSSLLYYLGFLQKIVSGFAWVMSRTMRLSGAESLSAAANIFMGQTEAPLLIKPYVAQMTRSEILCVMVGGMATIAGGVFAAYVGFLGGTDPARQLLFATHLLSASIMSAPAAIMASKMLLPETEPIDEISQISSEKMGANLLDAIANGTTEGLKLAVNVGAMLLVFLALMAMVNSILSDLIGHYTGLNELVKSWTNGEYAKLNLEFLFGALGAPVAWLIGTPTEDIMSIGRLLGEKTIINEFVAYTSLGTMKDAGTLVNQKSIIIAIYALCGFSNFGSIGIQIGGIGSLAPNQRPTIAALGMLALLGGTIACLMTAVIAGMLY